MPVRDRGHTSPSRCAGRGGAVQETPLSHRHSYGSVHSIYGADSCCSACALHSRKVLHLRMLARQPRERRTQLRKAPGSCKQALYTVLHAMRRYSSTGPALAARKRNHHR